jgi:hypothetical protein
MDRSTHGGTGANEMLLLGAGASKDAGLPDSFELTARVLDTMKASAFQAEPEVITYVIGSLLFAQGIAGENTLGARVDIEAVARAVERLENWQSKEIASFVTAWHPRVLELATKTPSYDHFSTGTTTVFASTRLLLQKVLTQILWTKETNSLDYLVAPRASLTRSVCTHRAASVRPHMGRGGSEFWHEQRYGPGGSLWRTEQTLGCRAIP